MELETLDDRDLVTRTRRGDRDAFAALVVRYEERVLNIIYRRLDDRELALDVSQEVFLKAYRGLDRFQGNAQFFTWLFRIALNETVSARRRQARHDHSASLDAPGPDGEPMPVPQDGAGPSAEAERLDEQALVQRAIRELDDDLGQIVVLRDIDGRSYDEIATILEVPLGSVKSRLHRARLALRDRLAPLIEPAVERNA